jgi:Spy/CpxP family protein refolding chaperone
MKFNKILTIVLAFGLIVVGALSVEAKHFGRNFGPRAMGPGLFGLRTLLELKLSDSQQTELLNIITKYENERKSFRDSMMKAKKNLSTVLNAEHFNEEEVRKAFQEASAIRQKRFMLRVKMMVELKLVLTPEQLELLKERKTQRIERIKHRLDTWLESSSE